MERKRGSVENVRDCPPLPGIICKMFLLLPVLCLATRSCPTLCDPMDYSLPGSSVLGDSPGKNTGVGCHALLQGIFPTQGSNPGLPYCGRIFFII